MPKPDYTLFLRALSGQECPRPTLFEPFIPRLLAEQLIWRRGPQLWDTPEHTADTMMSLRERTQADVVIVDARPYCMRSLFRLLCTLENGLCDGARAVLLSDRQEILREAEHSPAVCAVGGYGDTHPGNTPFLRMDKTAEDALSEGAAGYFAADNGLSLWERYRGRLSVCGGLGADFCNTASPVGLHTVLSDAFSVTRGAGFLPGSGGCMDESAYLQLISLLGGVIRLR